MKRLILSLCCLSIISVVDAETIYRRPDDAVLKHQLTPMQYYVTQQQGTEPAFKNAYWDNKQPGLYVDVVTGEPLFSSLDKYDSHTGWPSFTKPLAPSRVTYKEDHRLLSPRTEVLSAIGYSHLGHVFNDGPPPTYQRYCLNSAALLFIPVSDLVSKGYGDYLPLFQPTSKKMPLSH